MRLASIIICVVCFLLSVACSKTESAKPAKQSTLRIIKAAPEFSALSAEGTAFQSKNLRGSVWVAYFFFTSCGGPCPVMNERVAALQQELTASNLRFVGISVDPETDTPAILTKYGEHYKRDPKRWQMLNVPKDSLPAVAAQGFMLGSPDDPALHSTRFVLVDKNEQIRGFYDGMDEAEVKKLKAAIMELVQE